MTTKPATMKEPENPPAFPCIYEHAECTSEQHGMTLRDYFAGQAIVGLLAGATENDAITIQRNGEQVIGKAAYAVADAMLRARQPNPQP
jgi:hypothetical protein